MNFSDIGRWRGANHGTGSQEEIGIMETDEDFTLYAKFIWRNEKVGLEVLEKLVEHNALSAAGKDIFIFSKKRFYQSLHQQSR